MSNTPFITVIRVDGEQVDIEASWAAAKKEMNDVLLEPVWLPNGDCLLVDEEGLLKRLPLNHAASVIAQQPLVGTAILVPQHLVKQVLDGPEDEDED